MSAGCCAKPAVATMDYVKHTPRANGPGHTTSPRVNRCCTNCWAHWFGPPNRVTQYTSKQWDALLAEPAKPVSP
jgi:hypothetical protein